jgi:RNA polymerase primary sigma factor
MGLAYDRLYPDQTLNLYLKEIAKYKHFTFDEEAKLACRIRQGDRKALETLVKHNLRFVVSVSRNYQNQGLPLSDIINEGNHGLIKAAKRFDEKKNFKFISYAVWWIRQGILQALAEQSRIIKVPLHIVSTIHRSGKAKGRLEQKYKRSPDLEEIARDLNINPDYVKEAAPLAKGHISLDAPIQDEKDKSSLIDFITYQQEDYASPEEDAVQVSFIDDVNVLINSLDERERKIVKMYFGINKDRTPYTLEAIGQELNLTRERVRQIKEKALHRLKYRENNPINIKAHSRR